MGGRRRLMLTTTQAADVLGVSARRVRALIQSGRLPAERIGRDWTVRREDLDKLERKVGRPRKDD